MRSPGRYKHDGHWCISIILSAQLREQALGWLHGVDGPEHTTHPSAKGFAAKAPRTGRGHSFKLGDTTASFNLRKLRSFGTIMQISPAWVIKSICSLLYLLPPSLPWRLKGKQDYKGDCLGHISGVLF